MGIAKTIKKALNAEAIVNIRKRLAQDYMELSEFVDTDSFKEFKELDIIVNSDDFINNKRKIERLNYKKSEIYHDEKLSKKLSSNRRIKTYLKVASSDIFKEYSEFSSSKLHVQLSDLQSRGKKYLDKEDAERMSRYFKDEKIKSYYKFENSRDYRIYKSVENSQLLNEYLDISERVNTDKFKDQKAYLLNKNRYETTKDFQLLSNYKELCDSILVKKYLKYKDSADFDFIKDWELSFEDVFNDGTFDNLKWSSVFNNFDGILDSNVSLKEDKHFFTSGKNLSFEGNNLCITTKKESIDGNIFDPGIGIRKNQFDYSSGILTSKGSFTQKYGKFEAKIKLGDMSVSQCFWLSGGVNSPHIDIIKSISNNKALVSLIRAKTDLEHFVVNGLDLSNDYYIYTLIWSPEKIEWRINNIIVWTLTEGIPSEPLSLNFASCVYNDLKVATSKMLIDWVKVYKREE